MSTIRLVSVGFDADTTDPLTPDTDGDSVTDGQELHGYELTWMEPPDDGAIQHGPITYYSNPTDEHNAYYDAIKGRCMWRD